MCCGVGRCVVLLLVFVLVLRSQPWFVCCIAGKYFQQFLQDQAARMVIDGGTEVRSIFEEVPYTTLKYMIEKLYLEDFYYFCQRIGGTTAEVMGKLLRARADQVTISITLNSFHTLYNEVGLARRDVAGVSFPARSCGASLLQANQRSSSRRGLYPCLGQLYPEGVEALSKVRLVFALLSALQRGLASYVYGGGGWRASGRHRGQAGAVVRKVP